MTTEDQWEGSELLISAQHIRDMCKAVGWFLASKSCLIVSQVAMECICLF